MYPGVFRYLRGAMVIRTHDVHKKTYIILRVNTILGPGPDYNPLLECDVNIKRNYIRGRSDTRVPKGSVCTQAYFGSRYFVPSSGGMLIVNPPRVAIYAL